MELSDIRDICSRMESTFGLNGCYIKVDFVDGKIGGRYVGMCTSWNDGRAGYRIQLMRGMSRERTIWVLAHEFRHCIQRYYGWLRGDNEWRGCRIDTSAMAYNDRPWERDANAWADEHAPAFYHVGRASVEVRGRSFADMKFGR